MAALYVAGASLALIALGSGAMKVSEGKSERTRARKAERTQWLEIISSVTAGTPEGAAENPEAIMRIISKRVR
jgi:hypothetical protein